jgi:hypothetical protein
MEDGQAGTGLSSLATGRTIKHHLNADLLRDRFVDQFGGGSSGHQLLLTSWNLACAWPSGAVSPLVVPDGRLTDAPKTGHSFEWCGGQAHTPSH